MSSAAAAAADCFCGHDDASSRSRRLRSCGHRCHEACARALVAEFGAEAACPACGRAVRPAAASAVPLLCKRRWTREDVWAQAAADAERVAPEPGWSIRIYPD